ncbi:MerR family transcriptional regulator [Nonomuraea endophytica]|uniref:DNA-binding transcriptional MerR regulator n=1 Tax=Nonomuraea endophytica TaxID=714136 RepID=A0A7W8EJR2_9ACTN|nr:MerR family transcriptional regulator [Nonomuraea endophytica]MBB5081791.1 DNA-binding transcriptional MerR regulator [Nonomuraea endophytica]
MDGLTSIRTVADHFGLPISTLHYWERRGLVVPHRRARQRFYDTAQVYRVALIQPWRRSGLMGIDEIAALLSRTENWRDVVDSRMADIDAQQDRPAAARRYLGHLKQCDHGPSLEDCPRF